MSTVKAHKFYTTLDEVQRHAGTDSTLPQINCVRFEFHDDSIQLIASDRFSLLVGNVPHTDSDNSTIHRDRFDGTAISLPLDQVKLLMQVMRAHKLQAKTKQLDVTIEEVEVGRYVFSHEDTVLLDYRVPEHPAEFPAWRPLMKSFPSDVPVTRVNGERVGGRKQLDIVAQAEQPNRPNGLVANHYYAGDLILMGLVMPIRQPV